MSKNYCHLMVWFYTPYFINWNYSRSLKIYTRKSFLWWDLSIYFPEEIHSLLCPAVLCLSVYLCVCVCERENWILQEKHGRPPSPEGSANKPPASDLSDVKLLFSCGTTIFKSAALCPANSELLVLPPALMWCAACSYSVSAAYSSF